jgi:hypothetical protein
MEDGKDSSSSSSIGGKDLRSENVVYSPIVSTLHVQIEDFSQFDVTSLSIWHLRQ